MLATLELTRSRRHSFPGLKTPPPLNDQPGKSQNIPIVQVAQDSSPLSQLLSSPELCVPTGDLREAARAGSIDNSTKLRHSLSPVDTDKSAAPRSSPHDLSNPNNSIKNALRADRNSCGEDAPATRHDSAYSAKAVLDPGSPTRQTATDNFLVEEESLIVDCDCWDQVFSFSKNKFRKKLYVGKASIKPCPPALLAIWSEVRGRLMDDLASVLSWSSSNEFFEAELRMIGYSRGKKTVRLKPTVCIGCSTKACRKIFERAVGDLDYLKVFGEGNVKVGLWAPRLSASSTPPGTSRFGGEEETRTCAVPGNRRLAVQHVASGSSACGLKLRVIFASDEDHSKITSTIEGLVRVNQEIFGLTTAHGILGFSSPEKQTAPSTTASNSESDMDGVTDSDSESISITDGSSDASNHIKEESLYKEGQNGDSLAIQRTNLGNLTEPQQLEWKEVRHCGPMWFAGKGSLPDGADVLSLSRFGIDFALIDIGLSETYRLYNRVYPEHSGSQGVQFVRGIKHDGAIESGRVFLLNLDSTTPGFLLEGTACFRSKTVVFHTLKIELNRPLSKCRKQYDETD